MTTITISGKNQVVIPAEVRHKLNLRSGDKLLVKSVSKTEVVFKKQPSIHDLIGIVPPGKGDPAERIRKMRDTDD